MGKKNVTKSEKDKEDLDSLNLGLMNKDEIEEELLRLDLETKKWQLELLKENVREARAKANFAESDAKIRARAV